MTLALPRVLTDGRALVDPALRAAVDRLDPTLRHVAAYHLGWVEADGSPASGGGKALRPALSLLSAQAAGADLTVGLPAAVAVELVHNFSLLHDDVMDNDVQRRHRATVWAVWGTSTAILAGDAMLSLAHEVLAESGDHALAATSMLARCTRELIRGQVDDLAFEDQPVVDLDQCIAMAAGKTGALLGCSAALGAVVAGGSVDLVAALMTYGEQLGMAFQLVDDILGIWGDPARTGKPVGSDLRARKKSLPITFAVHSGTPAGDELRAWLSQPHEDDTEESLQHAADLVEQAGGREWTMLEAGARLALAESALTRVDMPAEVCAQLVAVSEFAAGREA